MFIKFNRFKINFQVVFDNFSADRWYQPLQKNQRHLLKKSNSIINFFKVTIFSKEWKVWPKTRFLVFALFVENFSNKHHYNLLNILRIFCFWYFCLKWLFLKLFVLKIDLCIKVVALIKITTVVFFEQKYLTLISALEIRVVSFCHYHLEIRTSVPKICIKQIIQ